LTPLESTVTKWYPYYPSKVRQAAREAP